MRSFKGFGFVKVMECVRCGAAGVVEGAVMETGGGGGQAFRGHGKFQLLNKEFG